MAKLPNPNDYPSMDKPKEKKEIEKVVSGIVKSKDPSVFRRLSRTVMSRDIESLKQYVMEDILWPGLIKSAHGAVDILFNRDVRSYGSDRKSNGVFRYDKVGQHSEKIDNKPFKAKRDFRELIFESRGDAEEVLSGLVDLIKDYKQASIADLYDLCDITSSFTDNKYGWTDLSGASVKRISDGYILDLPRAVQL